MNPFRFELLHTSKKSRARVGRIHTPHGVIDTPNFVAVGTNGTLKALDNAAVHDIGLQLMFCNTYHLVLQPGTKVVKEAGGLHKFINRSMPIITDSGGFQVFSLAYGSVADELKSRGTKKHGNSVIKIDEEGVLFRSYIDGSKVLLTPESSVHAQKDLGADIIIPFDELPPYHISPEALLRSFERTHRWQKRSVDTHLSMRQNQAMFAVIHGGLNWDLRKKSCEILRELGFDGFSIGGSLGKNKADILELLANTVPHLPDPFPRHLLGIGDLASLEASVPHGIDTFDSSYPTKLARHGVALSHQGQVNLTKGENKTNYGPISNDCQCYTCQKFSRAYLHHLFKAKELVALQLATIHNLYFMVHKMASIREAILSDSI
ncbi:MAG: tRNA-guanosine(34) transglycosylase [Verrucomicrobia bacterium]|nr:tRNA-guanosine(34) transglycosylase [Verrucomicrobiota bacterium]MBS0637266.1 tRNA-guanosine(34) transglycosylase [Verrucomicrobiota bacterium]